MPISLELRPASLDDADRLLEWRNDPLTRHFSHCSQVVSHQEHRAWLDRVLADPGRRLWMVWQGQHPIGTVRADHHPPYWELSWTMAPGHRGRGLAKPMAQLLAAQFSEPVRAEVRIGNHASAKIARACGMVFWKQVGLVTHFHRQKTRHQRTSR